jgi:membrane-bound metal-dependent hydrolase YbcI (DUF457 family)
MCLGRTHAIGGAALGAAAVDAYDTVTHATLPPAAWLAAVALAAGGALLNDLDTPSSTASHAAGRVTGWVAAGVAALSRLAFRLTATPLDQRHARGAHRGLTHTLAFALALTGGLVAADRASGYVTLGVATATLFLATRVALPRFGRPVGLGVAAASGVAVTWALRTGAPSWLLAGALGTGVLSHTLLDGCTTGGVPFWWPLALRGRRWRRVGTPWPLRFGTGGPAERYVAVTLALLGVLALPPVLTAALAAAHSR